MKEGTRVGALLDAKEKTVRFLGYGVYAGDMIPPKGVTGVFGDLGEIGMPNPKILLDNGDVVWGAQCWWGPEEQMKEYLADKTVINVDLQGRERAETKE